MDLLPLAGRVLIGLNKGEAHHTLKRAIRFYRRGALPDRTQLEQDLHAMALNLVVAAITLWNTAYLDRVSELWKSAECLCPPATCRIFPLWAGNTLPSQGHPSGRALNPLGDAFDHSGCLLSLN